MSKGEAMQSLGEHLGLTYDLLIFESAFCNIKITWTVLPVLCL